MRPATQGDAEQLAPRLRKADLREIQAASGGEPLAILQQGVASSVPCLAAVDSAGHLLALFGVIPDPDRSDTGMVWLLGSPELLRHRASILRMSREWVDRLHETYRVLWNFVDARNQVHVRWLQWSGFELLRLVAGHGFERRPFYQFERVRS
ncbi:MAG: hypothetical protein ACRD7E_22340, partial [Bryobacteraceae bacterium]